MRILIIGGTGFISGCTVDMLLAQDHEVTVFKRGLSRCFLTEHPELHAIYGDRNLRADLERVLSSGTYDAVYDFVAYVPEQSKLAVDLFSGKIGRFIHCSTVSIYMVSWDVHCPITEDQDKQPLMDYWDRNPFGMDYGIKKRQCEDVLWAAHDEKAFPVTMLRPTYVCGPGDPALNDLFWIERILDGGSLLVPGSGDFAFQNVYVDDVARAFVDLLDNENTIGQAYNMAAEEIFSLNEYLVRLGGLLDREVDLVQIEQDVFDRLPFSTSTNGDAFPFNTRRTAVFSLEKIKNVVGYTSTPFERWMPETIAWIQKHVSGHSVGYEYRRKELEVAERWKRVMYDVRGEFDK